MKDLIKRMLRVVGWSSLPTVISLILVIFVVKTWDRQLEVLIAGGLSSGGVMAWILICRSREDAADI
jgi:hypothetical protein